MTFVPIIIVGAPRSGTNMLRDTMTAMPGIETWPCDEINYIWRHGNTRFPSDEFPASLATPHVVTFIRKQFSKIAEGSGAQFVVEKTCANCLRLEFVNRVVPDAWYIFLRRDPFDVIASAMLRWTAPVDLAYLGKKLRFVPPGDIPRYALAFLRSRFHKLTSASQRLGSWGPVVNDMQAQYAGRQLDEICAIQWQACVNAAQRARSVLRSDRIVDVEYEQFVKNPVSSLSEILKRVGYHLDTQYSLLEESCLKVSGANVGKGRARLGEERCNELIQFISETGSAHNGESKIP